MSWRRFVTLLGGLSPDSRFVRAWSEDRKRDAGLAGRDVDGPGALQGMV